MADIELVIKIPEHYYEILKYDVEHGNDYKPIVLIANGTPLPKGHGKLIDADALEDEAFKCCGMVVVDYMDIQLAPTIIEADKESE